MNSLGLLFDMDGVIVDTNPWHHKSLTLFLASYNKHVTEEFLKESVWGRSNMEWIPAIFGEISFDELERLTNEKEELFRELYEPYIEPVKGLIGFLKRLKDAQIMSAVATSAPVENADFILERLDIKKCFNSIVTAANISKSKPDPQIYHIAAKNIRIPEECCIVIEDSLSGVAAGLAAGCKVIGITTTHTRNELAHCHNVIDNFDELSIEGLRELVNI